MRAPVAVLSATILGLAAAPAVASAGELIGVCGVELCTIAETGTVAPLSTDGTGNPYASPSVSADGRVLTYVREDGLYRAGPRGTAPERLLAIDRGDGRESAVSPDGGSFVFRTAGADFTGFDSDLRVGGAAGSALWSSRAFVSTAGWLGSALVVTQPFPSTGHDGACIVAVVPEGPPPCGQIVAADAARDVADPTGSPDGRLIAADAETRSPTGSTTDSRIVLYDAATGAIVRELTAGPADHGPSFSPDGTQLAFTRDGGTWVVPVAGGAARLLAAGVTSATWGAGPDAPSPGPGAPAPGNPAPGGSGTGAGTTANGRPRPPAARLRVRAGRVTIAVRCGTAGGCDRTRWTFREGKRTRLVVTVPALKNGGKRTLRVTLSRATAVKVRRAGARGLKLRLTGKGLKPRSVRIVRG